MAGVAHTYMQKEGFLSLNAWHNYWNFSDALYQGPSQGCTLKSTVTFCKPWLTWSGIFQIIELHVSSLTELITSSAYKCISVACYPTPNQPTRTLSNKWALYLKVRADKLFPGMTSRKKWITEYFHQEVVDSLRKANNSMIKWEVCYFPLLYIICEVWFLFLYFLSNSRQERITNITEGKMSLWNMRKMWSQIKVPHEGTENT